MKNNINKILINKFNIEEENLEAFYAILGFFYSDDKDKLNILNNDEIIDICEYCYGYLDLANILLKEYEKIKDKNIANLIIINGLKNVIREDDEANAAFFLNVLGWYHTDNIALCIKGKTL